MSTPPAEGSEERSPGSLSWGDERTSGDPGTESTPASGSLSGNASTDTVFDAPPPDRYPMRYEVAYLEPLSRWKSLLRLFLFLPVYLVMALAQWFSQVGMVFGFTAVFWRKKYPDWLFRGVSGAFAYQARVFGYGLLLTDRFPSFSPEDYPVTLEYDEPPSGHLSRWRVLFWKLVLLIPHVFVLFFLTLAVFAVTVIAWFAILFTGHYPRGMFQFVSGYERWRWRVAGYFASFNDRYPPFALSAEAGPGANSSVVICGVIGGLATAVFAGLIGIAIARNTNYYTAHMSYAQLEAGRQTPAYTFHQLGGSGSDSDVVLRLNRVVDPGDQLVQILRPASDERVVVFQWTIINRDANKHTIPLNPARVTYTYSDGDGDPAKKSERAVIVTVNDTTTPARIDGGSSVTVQAVFVIPEDAEPTELRYRGGFSRGGVKYKFDQ